MFFCCGVFFHSLNVCVRYVRISNGNFLKNTLNQIECVMHLLWKVLCSKNSLCFQTVCIFDLIVMNAILKCFILRHKIYFKLLIENQNIGTIWTFLLKKFRTIGRYRRLIKKNIRNVDFKLLRWLRAIFSCQIRSDRICSGNILKFWILVWKFWTFGTCENWGNWELNNVTLAFQSSLI